MKLNTKLHQVFQANPSYQKLLSQEDLGVLELLEADYLFSFQQLKQVSQWIVDCHMWKEISFFQCLEEVLVESNQSKSQQTTKQKAQYVFSHLDKKYSELKSKEKVYSTELKDEIFPKYKYENKELKGRIFRLCPAASDRAVCCNLKVLNLVDNCAMECSYCVLQNHYDEATIKVPTNLKEKLGDIKLQPEKRYRIGTGEYSDSLMWGNKNNILSDLCDFASKNPNAIIELKTKSSNVHYFTQNSIPKNVCCSWSLNPQIIISHEERKTASLKERLQAARTVADLGIPVGFHFHPMMYFEGWEKAYQELIQQVMELFSPSEVLWISLGCITLMKGFEHELREGYRHSKILQMETETTPDGKITYTFPVRERLYKNALDTLKPWKGDVFQYLCMEHKPMWDAVMDYTYKNVPEFEEDFNNSAFGKL
jgi:spore photoproduct lyase